VGQVADNPWKIPVAGGHPASPVSTHDPSPRQHAPAQSTPPQVVPYPWNAFGDVHVGTMDGAQLPSA
jgi:hypothetical protein